MSDDVGKAILGGINSALGVSENEPQNPVNPYSYEELGDFQQEINQSEERVYLQAGYTRKLKPRAMEILFQEPDATIVIKKRQFSSLAENYRLDRLDEKTRTYIRAVKRLFYNKCRRIAAYERLTKLEKIYSASPGEFNDLLFPAVFSFVEFFNAAGGLSSSNTNSFSSAIRDNFSVLDTLKKVRNLSDPELFTTWSNPAEIPYLADVGEGTGTFELTLATSISTSVSTQLGQGSCEISFENPFELMTITQEDIEEAISDIVGFTNNAFFNSVKGTLRSAINDLSTQLNSMRLARKASPIIIVSNPDTLEFKKVRAFIDEEGREIIFSYDPGLVGFGSSVSFDASARRGSNGLNQDDAKLLEQIIINYYSLFDNEKLTKNQIKTFNKENDYVRKKMRLEFEDRSIIQQQDVVHVFIGSKLSMDPSVSAGFNFSYSDANFFNQASKQLDAIRDMQSSLNDWDFTSINNGGTFVEFEKNAIAGPGFPLWLWLSMRNEFTRQAAGVHVFAGIVDDARQQYSSGKHTLSVSCKDFSNYLQKGQLNIKPAQDVVDSSVYDPLTPFKSDFDPASGILQGQTPQLLDENVALLNTEFARTKAGRNKGSIVNIKNYSLQDVEILTPESPFAKKRLKFFDPDGFVYRWKEGIGSLVLSGAPHSYGTGSVRKETSSVITNNPFSGQDVMNTLSLLITGQPYNFSTFLRAAAKSGYIKADKVISYSSSENFLKGLISDINKGNSIWGNFVPFKKIGMTDAAYRLMLQGEFDASVNNQYINDLLKKKADQLDSLSVFFPGGSNPRFFKVGTGNSSTSDSSSSQAPVNEALRIVGTDIFNLDKEINSYQEKFVETLSAKNIAGKGKIKIFGDDISVEGVDYSSASDEKKLQAQEQFRKNLFHLTQRRLWRVKANEDQNFFIVDDSYDKNYDIQAFEDALGDLTVFKSTYTSIFDQVKQAGDLLGLEVFADSQGHINARPPGYNKIPSSVLAELIKTKQEKGIQLFPDYLESLFFNQVKGLSDKLEILEDQIRLRAYLLGDQSDSEIGRTLGGSKEITGQANSNFSFITSEATGAIDVDGLSSLLIQNDPDFQEEANKQPLTAFNAKLTSAVNKNVQFDVVKRVKLITEVKSKPANPDKVKEVQNRLKAKYFEDPIFKDISNYRSEKGNLSQAKMLDLFSQIVPLISERQYVIKILVNALKNIEDGTTINSLSSTSTPPFKTSLFSSLNSTFESVKVPEVLTHMVEDEDFDDLGPGSGSRYIIKDSQVISFTITESAPPFTVVEVTGSIANNLVNGPSGVEVGSQGNLMNTAFVADYDMWRLYGFKSTQSVSIPFFDDPALQCAPYGVFLLNQARKNILNIDLTIIGNEFVQAGEVYYLESRDLLFYAENVRHQFDFGSGFQTSIKGTYVRKPGDFIPTMLDVIGKGLYTRRNQADLLRVIRNVPNDNETHLGVIKGLDNSITLDDFENSPEKNSFMEVNNQAIASILYSVSGFLNPSSYGKSVKVQLRIYHDSSPDPKLKSYANEVKKFLISPEKFTTSTSSSVSVPDDKITESLTDKDVEIIDIKLGDNNDNELRTPSSAAWDLARKLIKYPSGAKNDPEFTENNPDFVSGALKANLFLSVIDVWAEFTDNEDSGAETSNSSGEKTNENDQELENYLKNLAKAVAEANQTKQKVDEAIKTIAAAKK